ncbi:fasciclin domain-containing protein [Nocardia otitidiscaviarum]|uniref:Fasciclin domain-containing protein n=1 Tax=Nocardia otitidiscaviarum TaxID=1823 RepID=A0A516NGY6_9NOCA|nr:fasciclin domain-containing protein [Nocardia otitidiscaviarum]QDP78147.1 fasciclin domain-containing protein [Nocardia otitidiscaviarum]
MGAASDQRRSRSALPVSRWWRSTLIAAAVAVVVAGTGQVRTEYRTPDRLPHGHARADPSFTVFMPVAGAFRALDAGTTRWLRADRAALLRIIAYHTVPIGLPPEMLEGSYPTLAGRELTVTRGTHGLEVNGATVLRGGFRTADATVYVIDRVLTPPP